MDRYHIALIGLAALGLLAWAAARHREDLLRTEVQTLGRLWVV